jgi:hypothetical protein
MPITFDCSTCGRQVTAPDSAAGKKGKCPYCGQANDVPFLIDEQEDDLIPLAPIDEDEERRIQQERRRLYEQEQDLIGELGRPPPEPLEDREKLASEDLHHFVVNYCLDMAGGRLPRAAQHADQLKRHGILGIRAVDDFLGGTVREPALEHIPKPVLQGLLKELRVRVISRS